MKARVVPELARDVDDAAPLVQEEAGKAVAQVIVRARNCTRSRRFTQRDTADPNGGRTSGAHT